MKELDKKGLEFVKLDASTRIAKLEQKEKEIIARQQND